MSRDPLILTLNISMHSILDSNDNKNSKGFRDTTTPDKSRITTSGESIAQHGQNISLPHAAYGESAGRDSSTTGVHTTWMI